MRFVPVCGLWLFVAALLAVPATAPPTRFPAPDGEYMVPVPVPGGRIYVRVNGQVDGSDCQSSSAMAALAAPTGVCAIGSS